MKDADERIPDARGLRMGIVVSSYHGRITTALLEGAREGFTEAGGVMDDLVVIESPGAFELTTIAATLADRSDIDGVVALGCVITGETRHDRYICQAVAEGLTHVGINTRKPVAFGVLTCQVMEQAMDRSGGDKGNKGREAMHAAVFAHHAIKQAGGGS